MRDTGTQPLWKIVEDPNIPVKDKLKRVLLTATGVLGQQMGMISQVEGDVYRVVFITDETKASPGDTFSLQNTACAITLRQDQVVAIERTDRSPHYRHPSQAAPANGSYIGVPIYVKGGLFGTLTFIGKARSTAFSDSDRDFADVVGAMIGDVLDEWTAQSC